MDTFSQLQTSVQSQCLLKHMLLALVCSHSAIYTCYEMVNFHGICVLISGFIHSHILEPTMM